MVFLKPCLQKLNWFLQDNMKVTITSIELKSIFKFFVLSTYALSIVKQLKNSKYKGFKKQGFWTTHYTMTLWKNERDIIDFYKSGAHLKAMKESEKIAKEIRSITIDSDTFPSWKEAKVFLEKGKVIKF